VPAMIALASAKADSKAASSPGFGRQQTVFENHRDSMTERRPHPHGGAVTRAASRIRLREYRAPRRGLVVVSVTGTQVAARASMRRLAPPHSSAPDGPFLGECRVDQFVGPLALPPRTLPMVRLTPHSGSL
jgi:hypothetical protein